MIGIDTARVVPVSEDLTTEELGLSIVRGFDKMFRVDKKIGVGVDLVAGEWGVLGDDGMVSRPTTTPVANTYLVQAGTDRFDARATGQVTLIMNSNIIVKSNKFNTAGSYAAGVLLTARDTGTGAAVVTPAGAGEFVVGKVVEFANGILTYEVFPVVAKMA